MDEIPDTHIKHQPPYLIHFKTLTPVFQCWLLKINFQILFCQYCCWLHWPIYPRLSIMWAQTLVTAGRGPDTTGSSLSSLPLFATFLGHFWDTFLIVKVAKKCPSPFPPYGHSHVTQKNEIVRDKEDKFSKMIIGKVMLNFGLHSSLMFPRSKYYLLVTQRMGGIGGILKSKALML